MRKIYLLVVFSFLLLSCKSLFLQEGISGKYMFKGKDVWYTLRINADSTFFLIRNSMDLVPQCHGKWYYIAPDTLLLRCNKMKSPIERLSNDYMPQREWKVYLQRRNKVQLEGIPLKRVRRAESVNQ